MSQENVKVIRDALEAWARGDFDAALSFYADDVVFYSAGPDAHTYRGHSGVARLLEEWIGAFTDYWLETDDLLDAGDQVLQLFRQGGRGKSSGVPVETEGAIIYTIRDRKIVEGRVHVDQAEAVEATGLSE
jgi:uncharacterized protein